MTDRQKLFFIGWDYAETSTLPLKYALMDSVFPYEASGIVHDVVYVPTVDHIELITTAEFLQRDDLQAIRVLLLIKNPIERVLWERRIRALGMHQIDMGQLLREYADALAAIGLSRQVGAMTLPQAFDDDAYQALQAWRGQWPDAVSNRTFQGYLDFLRTGVPSGLASVIENGFSEHPFFSARHPWHEQFKATAEHPLVWEIAEKRSTFIEQAMISHTLDAQQYGFSSFDPGQAARQGHLLTTMLGCIGIAPALSHFQSSPGGLIQIPVSGAELPPAQALHKFVNIDVEQPLPLLRWLAATTRHLLLKTRIRRPRDLLECLQGFPSAHLALTCDRPGPAGLELTYYSAATEASA